MPIEIWVSTKRNQWVERSAGMDQARVVKTQGMKTSTDHRPQISREAAPRQPRPRRNKSPTKSSKKRNSNSHPSTHCIPTQLAMICRTCLRAASRARIPASSSNPYTRAFASAPTLRNATPVSASSAAAPRQGSVSSSHTPPAATSTSAAQPFSEPITPAAKKDAASTEKKAPLVRSSVPAGMPLKGLNFLKDKQDPVALADEEYPEWLWGILERQEKKGESAGAGDLFCKPLFHLGILDPLRAVEI